MNLPDVQAPAGSANFLKIKDKESIRGVFVGDMHHYHMKWQSGKSVLCDEKDADGKIRFKCNFVYHDAASDQLVTKIWEFPYSVFEQLKAINEDYPLEKTKVKITRNGTGQDTSYMILPLVGEKDKLTQNQIDGINNMPMHDLKKKGETTSNGAPPMPSANDDIPF